MYTTLYKVGAWAHRRTWDLGIFEFWDFPLEFQVRQQFKSDGDIINQRASEGFREPQIASKSLRGPQRASWGLREPIFFLFFLFHHFFSLFSHWFWVRHHFESDAKGLPRKSRKSPLVRRWWHDMSWGMWPECREWHDANDGNRFCFEYLLMSFLWFICSMVAKDYDSTTMEPLYFALSLWYFELLFFRALDIYLLSWLYMNI